MRTQELRN